MIRAKQDFLGEDAAHPPETFKFQTLGPFWLSPKQDLSFRSVAREFWNALGEANPEIDAAIGVYVFAVRRTTRSALIPWYVGKTDSGFRRRFHQHKKLFPKLFEKKGECALFLIARVDDSCRLRKSKTRLKSIDILETMLIERCVEINSQLMNASKIVHVKGLVVPGFKNEPKGKSTKSARQLKAMLGNQRS